MLARELGLCYASLAMATDYDCWRESEEAVNVQKVLQTMRYAAAGTTAGGSPRRRCVQLASSYFSLYTLGETFITVPNTVSPLVSLCSFKTFSIQLISIQIQFELHKN